MSEFEFEKNVRFREKRTISLKIRYHADFLEESREFGYHPDFLDEFRKFGEYPDFTDESRKFRENLCFLRERRSSGVRERFANIS